MSGNQIKRTDNQSVTRSEGPFYWKCVTLSDKRSLPAADRAQKNKKKQEEEEEKLSPGVKNSHNAHAACPSLSLALILAPGLFVSLWQQSKSGVAPLAPDRAFPLDETRGILRGQIWSRHSAGTTDATLSCCIIHTVVL